MKFPKNTGNAQVDEGYALMRDFLSHADIDAVEVLAIDYVHTFLGSGVSGYSAAYPFESVYTSPKRLMMQQARDEMLAIYKAAGLGKADSWKDAEDHLAVQLEYMTVLSTRISENYDAGNEDETIALLVSQKNFLEDHLLAWYPMMATDIEKFAKTSFYQGLGKLTSGFFESDKEFLDDILADVDFEDESANAREHELSKKSTDASDSAEDGVDASDSEEESAEA